jgi:hypothetical protein
MGRFDFDVNREWWTSGSETEQAAEGCLRYLERISEGLVDPIEHPDWLFHAWDVVLDSRCESAPTIRESLRAFQRRARHLDDLRLPLQERDTLRFQPAIWSAIIHHRLGDPRPALVHAYSALIALEDLVEHQVAVTDSLASATRNTAAELAVAILAILGASLRRAPLDDQTRARLVDSCRAYARSYALRARPPVIYPRSGALAAQLLYLFVEHGDLADRQLILALKELDERARPDHVRSRATALLVEHSFAVSQGNFAAADEIGKVALSPIENFPLPRHSRMIRRYGYLG